MHLLHRLSLLQIHIPHRVKLQQQATNRYRQGTETVLNNALASRADTQHVFVRPAVSTSQGERCMLLLEEICARNRARSSRAMHYIPVRSG